MRRKRSLHRTTVRGSILLFFESKETKERKVFLLSQGKLVSSHSTKDGSVHVGLIKVNRKAVPIPGLSTQGFSTFGCRSLCGRSWGQTRCPVGFPLPAAPIDSAPWLGGLGYLVDMTSWRLGWAGAKQGQARGALAG